MEAHVSRHPKGRKAEGPRGRIGLLGPVGLLALLGPLGLLGSAQTTPPQTKPQDKPQVFRAEANLVRVDAHVLKDGKPVTDLQMSDFEILEDNVPQKIEQFEYVRADRPQSAIPVEPSSSAAGMELAADPRNRLFVLFLDA